MNDKSGWVVGAEVVEVDQWQGYGKIYKIRKFHKNGKFSIEGDLRQFSISTGDAYHRDNWGLTHLRLVTDEVRADMNREFLGKLAHRAAKKLADALLRLDPAKAREFADDIQFLLEKITDGGAA